MVCPALFDKDALGILVIVNFLNFMNTFTCRGSEIQAVKFLELKTTKRRINKGH